MDGGADAAHVTLWSGPRKTLRFALFDSAFLAVTAMMLQKCAKRIEGDESGEAHCTGQYFDYWKCVDKCVRFSATTLLLCREESSVTFRLHATLWMLANQHETLTIGTLHNHVVQSAIPCLQAASKSSVNMRAVSAKAFPVPEVTADGLLLSSIPQLEDLTFHT